jgi:nitrile hydratase accessory protein
MSYLLDLSGPGAPPRSNGELVFAAPWESRTFGLALALHEAGYFPWEDFRQALMAEIRAWETEHAEGEEWSYYRCWQRALEHVLTGRGLVGADAMDARLRDLAARPAGHDHDVP